MIVRLLLFGAWLFSASLVLVAVEQPGVSGVWLGQDEHDFCQTSSALGANDIQDLHVRLENLPPDEEIESLIIRRDGGGQWDVNLKSRSWKGHLVREPKSTTADIFLEPSHNEPSCRLDCELRYQSGKLARFSIKGGRSNPNLFMPNATLGATWGGQDGHDWTGQGPAVGPDGFEDACVELTGLSTKLEIASILIVGAQGITWEYGLNPKGRSNAELVQEKKDRSRGQLFFSPDRDLNRETLNVHITYKIDRSNAITVLAGATDPKRSMPKPAPFEIKQSPIPLDGLIQWMGQDGKGVSGPADVHVVIDLLPTERILAAALSDKVGGYWIWRRDEKVNFFPPSKSGSFGSLPLILRRPPDAIPRAMTTELFFQPYRDETNTPMMLRLLLEEGKTVFLQFMGGKCDPYLRGPQPAPDIVDAKPSDDLHALAEKFGTIRLSKGRYTLDRPLKLSRPITITGDKDALLAFTQKSDEPAWSGGILIGASHVTLRGFSIRFADNFRWAVNGPGGAALIRSYDKPGSADPKAGIVLEHLDVESSVAPPPLDPKHPVEAPYLTRLAGATSGKIVGNRFRGGTVDVANGPWLIADNEHCGTLPGTVAWDAFGGHWLHDFTLERNRVHALEPSGKTWRFISMNQLGQRIIIRSNDVSGVGMRDNDLMPNPNAPEILLTESYRLYYEGKPAAISQDGWVVQVPMVLQSGVRPGSIVSILDGKNAGKFFTVAQPLAPTAFLMSEPLPAGDYAISVAHGYVDDVIEGNRIDVRGGNSAVIVLAGNHWGLTVRNNHLLGGGDSMLVQSTATEDPIIWGWSHTPFLGFLCEGNIHEDSLRGVSIDVESSKYIKTSRDRTYLSGIFRNNVIRWGALTAGNAKRKAEAIRIGDRSFAYESQMKVSLSGNRIENPTPLTAQASLLIRHATINNEPVPERRESLPISAQ